LLELPKSKRKPAKFRPISPAKMIGTVLEMIECWKNVFVPDLAKVSSFPEVI